MKAKGTPSGLGMIGLGMVGLAAVQSANATTEITFGGFTENNINISDIPNYGNNVTADSADYVVSVGAAGITGTPNIQLVWGVGYQTYTDWDGRGNVAQTDYNAAGGPDIDLILAPPSGYGVLISSFDLDAYAGGGDVSVSWSIFDIEGTLASGVWTQTDAGGRNTITTGLTVADIHPGEAVTLRLSRTSGAPSYLAMANLTFDQVPEPSTVALCAAGLGLGALAMRRRRK
ncbi:MAG TPA: PEP-CTERM sorting domain-containing protein [Verrucomicrobiota bacterium]|nr:hypothetical protein [Verrucomicrobiales bacterium]HRI13149.1 PEP-CTERM sorting domain-containing protein [Verrucomicrobiota bacterium]